MLSSKPSLNIWIIYSGVAVRESIHPVTSNGDFLCSACYGNIEGDRFIWFRDILSLVLILGFLA